MKIRDFIKLYVDTDIGNDCVDEELPAFVGPLKLTAAGEEKWAKVLDIQIDDQSYRIGNRKVDYWVAQVKDEKEFRRVSKFFWAAAGYVDDELYREWFEEEEDA